MGYFCYKETENYSFLEIFHNFAISYNRRSEILTQIKNIENEITDCLLRN